MAYSWIARFKKKIFYLLVVVIKDIKRFSINAASGWLVTIIYAVVGLILLPYMMMQLGMKGYGIYQLASSVLSFFMFLQLGMGPTLVRFFSQALTRNEPEELRKINSSGQLMLGGLGLLGCLLIVVLIPVFIDFYEIPDAMLVETAGLLICMAFSLFVNLNVMVPQGIVFASNRYDLANFIEISSHIMRLTIVVALFELVRPSLIFVGLSILSSQILRFAALLGVAFRYVGQVALFSVKRVSKGSACSIISFSVLNLVNSIATTIIFQSPILVVGKVLGAEMAAAFAPALIVSLAMQGILSQSTRPLVPLASKLREHNDVAVLGSWAVSAGQLAAFVAFGITLPFAIFGPELMNLWLGNNLIWIWPLVAILSTGVAISEIQATNYFLALGGGEITPTVYSQVVLAIVILAGNLIGVVWLDWGIFAVAFYNAICFLARNTFYLAYAYSKQFSYVYSRYLWLVYGLPALIASFCVCFGWLFKIMISSRNQILLVTEGILVLVAYVVLCWLFLLPSQVTIKITALFRSYMMKKK